MADSLTYEIEKKLGVLSRSENGWRKEVNLISWNNGIVKLDVREWDEENKKMKKGITLTRSEVYTLFGIIKHLDFNEIGDYGNRSQGGGKWTSNGLPSQGNNTGGANGGHPVQPGNQEEDEGEKLLEEGYVCAKKDENEDVPFEGIGSEGPQTADIVAEADDEDYE